MIKNILKKTFFVIGAVVLAFSQSSSMTGSNVLAVEQGDIDDAKEQLAQKEEEIKKLQSQLESLSTDITSTQSYITQLDGMLAKLTIQLNDCNQKIDAKKTQIDAKIAEIDAKQIEINNTQIELNEAQLSEANQYQAMSDRIQYMYECGEETFLDMLFTAEDMSDLLGRSEYIADITAYDREQLDKMIDISS